MPINVQIYLHTPSSEDPYGILDSTSTTENSARKVKPSKRKRKLRKTTTAYPSNIDPFNSISTFEDSSESSAITLMSDCRCGEASSAKRVKPSKGTRKPRKTTTPYANNIDPFDSIPTFEDSSESSDFTLTSKSDCGCAADCSCRLPSF